MAVSYLQTDGHDDIWLTFLWFVGFHSWIDQLHQFVEDGLERTV